MLPMFGNAIVGGLLIGLAASLLLYLCGRIAGISGIFRQVLLSGRAGLGSDNLWRWTFLLGLPLGALVVHFAVGIPLPQPTASATWLPAVAGLIVGVGVTFGSGCTSGHGICGISRLSLRSIMATMAFIASGMLAVGLLRHIVGG